MKPYLFLEIAVWGNIILIALTGIVYWYADLREKIFLANFDKEMEFASKFNCIAVVRSMNDFPLDKSDGRNIHHERYLWFAKRDRISNFVSRHSNRFAFCIVGTENNEWVVHPIIVTYSDNAIDYYPTIDHIRIPDGIDDIYRISDVQSYLNGNMNYLKQAYIHS